MEWANCDDGGKGCLLSARPVLLPEEPENQNDSIKEFKATQIRAEETENPRPCAETIELVVEHIWERCS